MCLHYLGLAHLNVAASNGRSGGWAEAEVVEGICAQKPHTHTHLMDGGGGLREKEGQSCMCIHCRGRRLRKVHSQKWLIVVVVLGLPNPYTLILNFREYYCCLCVDFFASHVKGEGQAEPTSQRTKTIPVILPAASAVGFMHFAFYANNRYEYLCESEIDD